jgi:hypothetical protein
LKVELTGDELILALIALVRAINPKMLVADGDGFTLDFTPLVGKESLSSDEQLLIKLRTAAETEEPSFNLSSAEANRIASTMERLETLQQWPEDVLKMSRAVRVRLLAAS